MKIFTESNTYDDAKFPYTSARKRFFKEDEKGEKIMCDIMKEVWNEGKAEGKAEGELMMLIMLVKDGLLDVDEAVKRSGKTYEEIKQLIRDENN